MFDTAGQVGRQEGPGFRRCRSPVAIGLWLLVHFSSNKRAFAMKALDGRSAGERRACARHSWDQRETFHEPSSRTALFRPPAEEDLAERRGGLVEGVEHVERLLDGGLFDEVPDQRRVCSVRVLDRGLEDGIGHARVGTVDLLQVAIVENLAGPREEVTMTMCSRSAFT